MNTGSAIAALVLAAVVIWFTARCLVDLARSTNVRVMSREAWAVLCVLSMPLGGILYVMYGRDR